MKSLFVVTASVTAGIVGHAFAQGALGDYRVRADFVTPSNGLWGEHESVGNADFRIHSRYLAVYYGGVLRQDNFTFSVQLDFRDISGFATQFTTSPYNTNFDVYINDDFVGRVPMSSSEPGLAELTYKSRNPTPPELPVPAAWPSPINPGSTVRVFAAAAVLPAIGDPVPVGTPVFTSTLEEKFARGDADHDGHVDEADFSILASTFDPANIIGPHIGPAAGDFTGDNRSDLADYDVMVLNWDGKKDPPAAPVACLGVPLSPNSTTACAGSATSLSVTATGTGPFTYQWRRNGLAISTLANTTARSRTLSFTNAQPANNGSYDCLISTACGSTSSTPATLTVRCTADFDNSGGTPDASDIDAYFQAWLAGDQSTDADCSGGTPDASDIDAFFADWLNGGC